MNAAKTSKEDVGGRTEAAEKEQGREAVKHSRSVEDFTIERPRKIDTREGIILRTKAVAQANIMMYTKRTDLERSIFEADKPTSY
jgi:hypothetical protein